MGTTENSAVSFRHTFSTNFVFGHQIPLPHFDLFSVVVVVVAAFVIVIVVGRRLRDDSVTR